MTVYFDVYAIQLTEENIPQITEKTAPLGWTLGHLSDNMECNVIEDGVGTMLYMKLFRGTTEIATFNDEPYDFSDPDIRLTDETDPLFGIFHKFEKI